MSLLVRSTPLLSFINKSTQSLGTLEYMFLNSSKGNFLTFILMDSITMTVLVCYTHLMEVVEGLDSHSENKWTVSEKEVPLKSGETVRLPTLHIAKMLLYHGSPVADITTFEEGDQQTIGEGIYFAPTREAAEGYARSRNKSGGLPTIYEAEVSDADLADLRTREAQEQFAKLYRQSLLGWEKNALPNLKGPSEEVTKIIKEQRKEAVANLVNKIDSNSWFQLRDLTFGWADLVSKTLSDIGYKGLISIEGEPPQVDLHDSVVIFNPEDTKISRACEINL